MEIIDLTNPNVVIVKNFFTEEEINKVLNVLKSYNEEDWYFYSQEKEKHGTKATGKLLENDFKFWAGMSIDLTQRVRAKNRFPELPHEFLIQKEIEIKKIVENKFKDSLVLQLSGLNRWRPGRYQTPHLDYFDSSEDHDFEMLEKYNQPKHVLEEFEKVFNDKHYASLMYFNTDYIGGELYMPQWNWEIKPEPGMLIVFKGDENHLHGVKLVEEGLRYTWSVFWTKMDWAIKNKPSSLE